MTFAIPLQMHVIWHPKDDNHCCLPILIAALHTGDGGSSSPQWPPR
jgi:hypothetical protein